MPRKRGYHVQWPKEASQNDWLAELHPTPSPHLLSPHSILISPSSDDNSSIRAAFGMAFSPVIPVHNRRHEFESHLRVLLAGPICGKPKAVRLPSVSTKVQLNPSSEDRHFASSQRGNYPLH